MTARAVAAPVSALGLSLRLGLFYAAYFLFLGLFMPYWPVWLAAHGLTAAEIGILVALTQVLKASTAPFVAQLSDQSGRRRGLLLLAAILAPLSFVLFLWAESYRAIIAITFLCHLFIPALLPLNEQLTMAAVRQHGIDYGRTRAIGSATFVAGSLAGGVIIAKYGASGLYWAMLLALMTPAAAALFLPGDQARRGSRRLALSLGPVLDLLRQARFRRLMLAVSFLQASHGVYYVVGTLHWQAAGFDSRVIGGLWALAVIAEIMLFVTLGRWLAARPVRLVLTVVGLAGTVRWAVTGLTLSWPVLAAVQCLHALTYGATHMATMEYLSRTVADSRAAVAQALYSAIPMGVAMGLVLVFSGALYEAAGAGAYWAMAGLTAVGAWLARGLEEVKAPPRPTP